MSEALYQQIKTTCSEDEMKGIVMPLSKRCAELVNVRMTEEVGFWYAYEGDTDACGLQTAPIEDIWFPFFANDTGVWTPVGPLNAETAKPLGLKMTQSWRPFGIVPAGRNVQGG